MAQGSSGIRSGVCKNLPANCEKAATKEAQRAASARFVCAECGMELRPEPGKSGPGMPKWVLPGAGAVLSLVLLGLGAQFMMAESSPSCPSDSLDDFLAQSPAPATALEAAFACRDAIRTPADAALVASVARLCRVASDAGSAEGMRCLAELYDPKELRPGRLGQMPTPDLELSSDLYKRAEKLTGRSGTGAPVSPEEGTASAQ